MRISTWLLAAGMVGVMAVPARAQDSDMPESYRQVQANALELQRSMLISMVDSMPEQQYRDKATPAQRDFAQQIQHAAGAVVFIATRFLGATPPAGRPDTASVLNSKAGLRSYVNSIYDWAAITLKNQSERGKAVNLMGKPMPAWQVWDEIHQHTVWTAGQVVANFRKHGMAPPGFGFF
jgi:hypothetical protein